jgi:hypothetical protein
VLDLTKRKVQPIHGHGHRSPDRVKGRGRIALRAGCLLFAPFITLFVWMVQGMIWVAISTPILAYALLMAGVGGGFSRDHRHHQPFSRIAPNPPPPPP